MVVPGFIQRKFDPRVRRGPTTTAAHPDQVKEALQLTITQARLTDDRGKPLDNGMIARKVPDKTQAAGTGTGQKDEAALTQGEPVTEGKATSAGNNNDGESGGSNLIFMPAAGINDDSDDAGLNHPMRLSLSDAKSKVCSLRAIFSSGKNICQNGSQPANLDDRGCSDLNLILLSSILFVSCNLFMN